ncbi:MAG: CvpA family protein [Lachnospiraceae bacterium]|nr:CvpA family protein [Lachnospiraceae bacterium]
MREFILNNLIFILVVLFLVFGFIRGRELGLVKKIMSIGMLIATIIITKVMTPHVVNIIKDVTNIEATISDMIYEAFNKTDFFDSKLNIGILGNITGTEGLLDNMKNTVATSVANVIINIMCGIAVFLITMILLKIIFRILDIIDYIPVVGEINKLLGGCFGLFESLLVVWLVFAIIKAFDNNIPAVHDIVEKISANFFIKFLYDHNSVYNFFASLFGAFKKV